MRSLGLLRYPRRLEGSAESRPWLSRVTGVLRDGAGNKKPRHLLETGVACVGRRDWTRTNDPHHVKVVL